MRVLLLSGALALPAGQAWAQQATTTNADGKSVTPQSMAADPEIIVTATRREEKLSRVPVSVAAFTQAKLDRQGVKSIDDLVRLTPGLNFSRASGTTSGYTSSISIRGVSSLVGAATTGVYIDDTPVQARSLLIVSGNAFPQVFDLDRVEVLRGPQGTLFGAGSEGGAIRFITPQPDFHKTSGSVRFEVGDTDGGLPSYEAGGALGMPIVDDKLAARASLWYRRDGGWIDRTNPDTGQVLDRNGNAEKSYAGKFAVAWRPVADLTITPSVYYQNIHDDERTQYWEKLSSSGQYRDGSLIPEPMHDKFVLPAVKLQYSGSAISVVSNTSYFKREFQSTYNYTQYVLGALGFPTTLPVPEGLPGSADSSISGIKQRNFTEELRVQSASEGPLQWVLGAFYTHNRQIGDQHLNGLTTNAIFTSLLGVGYQGLTGIPLLDGKYTFVTHLSSLETQKALFADVTYTVLPRVKLEAGIRVARTHFSYEQASEGPLVAAEPLITSGSKAEKPVTPKFGMSFQMDRNNFFYFSAAKGFRVGGAQPQLISSCDAELASLGYKTSPTSYNSDSLWSYEIGSKNTLFGGRLHVDASVFYVDWSNIQSQIRLDSCGGSVIVGNLGSATSKGFDLALDAKVVRNLTLSLAMGYAKSKYNDTIKSDSGQIFSRDGEPLGGPPFNLTASAQYDMQFIGDHPAYLRVDYQYRSKSPAPDPAIFDYDASLGRMPAQNYVNLRVGSVIHDWDVSIFANNVTNSTPGLFRSHDNKVSTIFYNTTVRPRYIGVTALRRF